MLSLPQEPKLKFSVLRVPFFLEPEYPEDEPHVETNRQRLSKKWGSFWPEQKRRHDLKGRGKAAGIEHFNLDRLVGNSMASHRLIQMVGKEYGLNVSEGLYDRLNRYYFEEGYSLNDKPLLAQVTAETLSQLLTANNIRPPTPEEILTFLQGNAGRKEIEQALQTLHALGIHSVPKFIIEGRTVVDGAANWKVFVDIFMDIQKRNKVYSGPVFAEILGVSSEIIQRGSYFA